MKTKGRTPGQLAKELQRLRRWIAELEKSEAEHKKVEAELQESQARYQALFDRSLYCVFVHDFDGRFLDANDAAFNLLGYTKKEFPATLASLLDQDQVEIAFNRGKEIKRTGASSEPFEYRLKKRNGGYVWVEIESSLIYRGGKPYAIQGIARDITARKQAEEALRESEEKYRDLVENIDDIIYATDEQGIITYIAPRIEDVGGYTTSEIIGRPFFDFVHEEDVPYMRDMFEQDLSGRAEPREYRAVNKAGDVRWVRVSSRPFYKEKRVIGLRGVMTDFTARKHAEEELQRSYKQLRETFIETVNALASTVEMKDPYTAGHQRWATRLACAIAKEMGLSEGQIEGIRMAGLIHDIGKINIPAEILSKPGQLSDIQYNMVKIHAQVGCDILREIKFPWPVAKIVLQHHERWDGSGYPEGLSGEEIILEARILAVADTVEAMSSHRPYRVAHGIERALAEISQHRGTLYDPAVVDACLVLFEKGFRFD
jgi:PAS domain S-box-containing protein/putative nucleotidyltransferase with HDIG domain